MLEWAQHKSDNMLQMLINIKGTKSGTQLNDSKL